MNSPTLHPQADLPEELRTVSVVKMTDPTVAAELFRLVKMDIVNLDAEQFEVKRTIVPLETCFIVYVYCNAAVRTLARVHKDFEGFITLGPQVRGTIDGGRLNPREMIVAGQGTVAELITDRDYESISLLMPPGVIDQHLAARGIKKDFVIPDGHEVWHPAATVAEGHFELGVRIVDAAEKSPEIFNNNHWARSGAQVEFMDSLLATIETCNPDERVDNEKKGKSNSEIVRACEDYTLSLDGRRPYLSELCSAAKVGERTVQYAFKDIMGMSPLTYLNRLRLHRARDDLRKATSGSTTVSDVATKWGFWEFGEFSRAYKNCFEETPSSTLKRNAND
jgi:AraC family ethanolamine operon transcriptional activator